MSSRELWCYTKNHINLDMFGPKEIVLQKFPKHVLKSIMPLVNRLDFIKF